MAVQLTQFSDDQIADIRQIVANDIVHGASGTHVRMVVEQVVTSATTAFAEQTRLMKAQADEIEITRVAMQTMHDTFESAAQLANKQVSDEIQAMQVHQQAIVKKIGDQDEVATQHNLKFAEATVRYENMKSLTEELEAKFRVYCEQREKDFEGKIRGAEEVFQGHLKKASELIGQAQAGGFS